MTIKCQGAIFSVESSYVVPQGGVFRPDGRFAKAIPVAFAGPESKPGAEAVWDTPSVLSCCDVCTFCGLT